MQSINPRKRKTYGTSRILSPPFYVISDTHWFHKNIIKYCSRDMNHDNIMIDRWKKAVSADDYVLHLGDLVFTRDEWLTESFFTDISPSLPGRKFLILGNHDKTGPWLERYEQGGWNVIKPFMMRYKGYDVSFDHYPTESGMIHPGSKQIRVHGHIHNNGYNHFREKHREMQRYGNVNVSVEAIDYTPQPVESVLDKAIENMKPKQKYHNVNKNGAKRRYEAA